MPHWGFEEPPESERVWGGLRILWLNNYIESHKSIDANRTMCKTIGVVESVKDNPSICLIRSKRVGHETSICLSTIAKGLVGKKVVVIKEAINTNSKTQELYPYFVTKLQSLEKENGSK